MCQRTQERGKTAYMHVIGVVEVGVKVVAIVVAEVSVMVVVVVVLVKMQEFWRIL